MANPAPRSSSLNAKSRAFVGLPGGFGTLDEFCEIVTWAQIGIHKKPIALLNTENFWDGFLEFARKGVDEGFIQETHLRMIKLATTPEELLIQFG